MLNFVWRQNMGKKVYTINGKMYIIDDDTGEIKTIHIDSDQIPPNELREIIKALAKNQKDD
jgi:cytidylate kinase